jgi:hypothetical protein
MGIRYRFAFGSASSYYFNDLAIPSIVPDQMKHANEIISALHNKELAEKIRTVSRDKHSMPIAVGEEIRYKLGEFYARRIFLTIRMALMKSIGSRDSCPPPPKKKQ